MTALAFWVEGEPAPKGSLVAVQKGVYLESNRKTLNPWLAAIKAKARKLEKLGTLDGNLTVDLIFYLTRPKTVTRLLPNVKPDLDKLVRSVFDGLKGFIEDDARIVNVTATKLYAQAGSPAGVYVQIEKIENAPLQESYKVINK